MKKRNLIAALALTLSIGLGVTAYAAGTPATTTTNGASAQQRLGLNRTTGKRGFDFVTSVLKNKLGVTDAEITEARNSGKTLTEFAEEKGLSSDDFKAALTEEKSKSIDEAVKNGTLTQEDGNAIKEKIQSNSANCTGNFGANGEQCGLGNGIGRNSKGGQGRNSNNGIGNGAGRNINK